MIDINKFYAIRFQNKKEVCVSQLSKSRSHGNKKLWTKPSFYPLDEVSSFFKIWRLFHKHLTPLGIKIKASDSVHKRYDITFVVLCETTNNRNGTIVVTVEAAGSFARTTTHTLTHSSQSSYFQLHRCGTVSIDSFCKYSWYRSGTYIR